MSSARRRGTDGRLLLLWGFALALAPLAVGSAARDAYATLGVARSASASQIRSAFRSRALTLHPDKNPPEKRAAAERKFAALGEAYETLSDPAKRRAYDAAGGAARSGQGVATSRAQQQPYWKGRRPPGFSGGDGGGGRGRTSQQQQREQQQQQEQRKQRQKQEKQKQKQSKKQSQSQSQQHQHQQQQQQRTTKSQYAGEHMHETPEQSSAPQAEPERLPAPLSRAVADEQCPIGSPLCVLLVMPHVSLQSRVDSIYQALRTAAELRLNDGSALRVSFVDSNAEPTLASAMYVLQADASRARAGGKPQPSLWGRDVTVVAYKRKRAGAERAAVLTGSASPTNAVAFARSAVGGDLSFVSTSGDLMRHLL